MGDIFTVWPELTPDLGLVIYVLIIFWALAYILNFGWAGLKEAASEFRGFSVHGFSVKRMAYLLVIFDLALTALHFGTRWEMDAAIMLAALLISLGTLTLAFLVPKTAQGRFLPFAFSIVLLANHSLLCRA